MTRLIVLSLFLAPAWSFAQHNSATTPKSLIYGVPDTSNLSGATYTTTGAGSNFPGCGAAFLDVWYSFVAQSPNTTITVTKTGGAGNRRFQLYYGSWGSFTGSVCSSADVLNATGLTVGTRYLVRVHGSNTSSYNFIIRVTNTDLPNSGEAGIRREVFDLQLLANATTGTGGQSLNDPWEVIYGPDNFLWITESRGYKVYRMNASTGVKTTVLDISRNSTFLNGNSANPFNLQFDFAARGNPQGGLAGMAIHPDFANKPYVYISYIHKYVTELPTNQGKFFLNNIVRFTYNSGTNKLEDPVSLCDTLPGSGDHNSQRMIIAPVNGTNYLFYAAGDMGAGQFANANRPIHSHQIEYYEGKILRFNLEPENDPATSFDDWIPDNNPFNLPGKQSAVWAYGIRNNQGFAYANFNGVDRLYGSSHGPFTDDEINILEEAKDYGHPYVIGFRGDGNYNGAKAGVGTGTLPLINDEDAYATNTIGLNTYRDPIFCFYNAPRGTTGTAGSVQYIYNQFNSGNQNNASWPSLGTAGMDYYNYTAIPGWKNSLILATLKGGRIERMKLTADGSAIVPPGTDPSDKEDVIDYFRSTNRFRDVALSQDGRSVFFVIDRSQTTSGPTTSNPVQSACAGCVQKFTFLGYNDDGTGKSTISQKIPVSTGTPNTCVPGTPVTINAANKNTGLWVPITGPDGNIVAEIFANGNNLGTVTSSFYVKSGAVRVKQGKKYLNRNVTITPENQPATPVKIRLYFTRAEMQDLIDAGGAASYGTMLILKNQEACGSEVTKSTESITAENLTHGTDYYVLQGEISSFSSFFFGVAGFSSLPVDLLTFNGVLQNNATQLDWKTSQEVNMSHFEIERSIDGTNYAAIGSVNAAGSSSTTTDYAFTDNDVTSLAANVVYYRLKIVDKDGEFKYSNIITLSLASYARITVTPNPVITGNVRVAITADKAGRADWKLTDNAGRVVIQGSAQVSRGNNQVLLNVDKLAGGIYHLTVEGVGLKQQVKLQKL